MHEQPAVIELRHYTLHPGRRDELIDLFEREFMEPQQRAGISLRGLFRDPENPDAFIWIRSFPDMESRRAALTAFYDGPVWQKHRNAANATMIDSDNVLLLRGDEKFAGIAAGSLYCAIYLSPDQEALSTFETRFKSALQPALQARAVNIIATWRTANEPNTFPRLPVRENEHAMVVLATAPDATALQSTHPAQLIELTPTEKSPLQTRFQGSRQDFQFLKGNWNVHHRIRAKRLQDCNDWIERSATARGDVLLDGIVSVDEIGVADRGTGCSFRHLDLARNRWSIYWTNSLTGKLFTPVHGGFENHRGEFYGYDTEGATDVFVRYLWTETNTPTPQWQQAFSTDGGQTWETNWIMQFTRQN